MAAFCGSVLPGVWRMCASPPPAPSQSSKSSVCVVGAGVIGLTAASRLVARGFDVTIVARETIHSAAAGRTPETPYTSVSSGGLWWPFHIEPDDKVEAWSRRTYDTLVDQHRQLGGDIGVSVVEGFVLHAREEQPELPWYAALTRMEVVNHERDPRVPRRYASALRFKAPIVQADVYLAWLHRELVNVHNVRVVTDLRAWDFETVAAFARHEIGAHVVVNATGIGARSFVGDDAVVAGRGVLLFGKRSAAQDAFTGYFITEAEEDGFESADGALAYAFPRGNERILLGGTIGGPDDVRNVADVDEVEGVRSRIGRIVPCLRDVEEDYRWAGLRPLRRGGVRLERDAADATVIHCYGHGGGGFTTAWGCAEEVADLTAST
jgi:D-amino-acid oxidase